MKENQKKIIIGITGASGAIYGIKLVEALLSLLVEVHLVISKTAKITIEYETNYKYSELINSVSYNYDNSDLAARISSGSSEIDAMIIAPCSIKTMSQIASGNIDNLVARAADVTLKERRKLILMVRESPLHLGHLRNMALLSEIGAIIAPPMPAMYALPKSIDDLVNHTIGKILNLCNINNNLLKKWKGV